MKNLCSNLCGGRSARLYSDVPGDEVTDGGLELGCRQVGEQRGALTGGGISEDHEEEAHHGQTAVLDLSELHVVPLLQLNSRLRRTGFKRLSPIHLPDHLPTFARAERCKAPLADTLQ